MSKKMNYQSKLGYDLPNSEDELFVLEKFPLLDIVEGIKTIGDVTMLRELLHLMINQSIPEDELLIQNAYLANDWESIENIAHKMKSGALYCGTVRMQYACQYLERYRKAGHKIFLDDLYHQLLTVLKDTRACVNYWLTNN